MHITADQARPAELLPDLLYNSACVIVLLVAHLTHNEGGRGMSDEQVHLLAPEAPTLLQGGLLLLPPLAALCPEFPIDRPRTAEEAYEGEAGSLWHSSPSDPGGGPATRFLLE